ncbi:hypothetical protein QBC34DRAFT_469120 [Podospora aff. communis PSN243]|uniref:Uncharacterized protein n=1 Tax=Podospora aff. communis PSN243 TaxID=3040156 RepID=A0AAV9GI34_9PEZI|nr:hypothetical protein QBC34DRAFT_469120 [Podospora aff. communis PSN243]
MSYNLTEITKCVSQIQGPLSTFNHSGCFSRYQDCLGEEVAFSGYIPLSDCNLNCGSHQWYTPKDFIDRVHWLLPVILLASNFQLPPLGYRVKAFAILHLLGDPIDTILSLKHTLQIKHQSLSWARKTLNRNLITSVTVTTSDLSELAFALDSLQARSSPHPRNSLEALIATTPPEKSPTLLRALRTAGEDLRTTKVTIALPSVVTILVFIANIVNELVDSASASQQKDGAATDKKPPGNRIAFAVLFSWMLPAVLLSAACHRYCEANSCWRAVERFLDSVERAPGDVGLPGNVFPASDREKAPASAAYSGTVYSFRPEKMRLRWVVFREEWEGVRFRRMASSRWGKRRGSIQQGEVAVRRWLWHELRHHLPTLLAVLPTLLAFTFAMGISYITPTGEFSMRCVVQLSVFLAWLLSFALTCLGNLWLGRDQPPPPHGKAMVVFWLVCFKDGVFAVGTLLVVLLVNGGLLNSCFGWSNGWSGMVTGNQYVSLKWDEELRVNVSERYPAFVASGILVQLSLFLLLWQPWLRLRRL